MIEKIKDLVEIAVGLATLYTLLKPKSKSKRRRR